MKETLQKMSQTDASSNRKNTEKEMKMGGRHATKTESYKQVNIPSKKKTKSEYF